MITSASDDARKDRKAHMEKASEVNRNFFKLSFPKIFSLPQNLTHIHVDYIAASFGKRKYHILLKISIFLLFPWNWWPEPNVGDKEALSFPHSKKNFVARSSNLLQGELRGRQTFTISTTSKPSTPPQDPIPSPYTED